MNDKEKINLIKHIIHRLTASDSIYVEESAFKGFHATVHDPDDMNYEYLKLLSLSLNTEKIRWEFREYGNPVSYPSLCLFIDQIDI